MPAIASMVNVLRLEETARLYFKLKGFVDVITLILLTWIGTRLQAPTWYYGVIIVGFVFQSISFGMKMYTQDKDSK